MSQGSKNFYAFPVAEIKRLMQRLWILEHLPKNAIGAELGVFRGHFSEFIVTNLTPKKFYMVDPWTLCGEFFGWKGQSEYFAYGALPTAFARDEARGRVERFTETEVQIVEASAFDFLRQLRKDIAATKAEPLDFVYLDADHGYQFTKDILPEIASVMTPEGIIAGDDWRKQPTAKHHGVYRAVQEFTKESNYQIMVAGPAAQFALRQTPNYDQIDG